MKIEGCTLDELRQQIGEEAFARLAEFGKRCDALAKLFEERGRCCKSLGFSDYKEYLSSDLWKDLSRATLKRKSKICARCGGKANQVHHRSYSLEVLKGDRGDIDEQLVSVCGGCHNIIHYNEYGVDRFVDEWDAVLMSKEAKEGPSAATASKGLDEFNRKRPSGWKRMTAIEQKAWTESRPKDRIRGKDAKR
jgi:hypothetical protein